MPEHSTGKALLPALGKFWTFPNVLSMMRLVLVLPVFYLIITDGSLTLIFTLIFIGIATDWFDGQMARWTNAVSEWGKVLDPLADKIAAFFAVLALVINGALPAWFLFALIARDLVILIGGIFLTRRTGEVVMSMWSGKVAITAVTITIVAGILRADPELLILCIWVTLALLAYSFIRYVIRFARLWRQAPVSTE